jgi:hypothetical protein
MLRGWELETVERKLEKVPSDTFEPVGSTGHLRFVNDLLMAAELRRSS